MFVLEYIQGIAVEALIDDEFNRVMSVSIAMHLLLWAEARSRVVGPARESLRE